MGKERTKTHTILLFFDDSTSCENNGVGGGGCCVVEVILRYFHFVSERASERCLCRGWWWKNFSSFIPMWKWSGRASNETKCLMKCGNKIEKQKLNEADFVLKFHFCCFSFPSEKEKLSAIFARRGEMNGGGGGFSPFPFCFYFSFLCLFDFISCSESFRFSFFPSLSPPTTGSN
jgi:hypothetical protein